MSAPPPPPPPVSSAEGVHPYATVDSFSPPADSHAARWVQPAGIHNAAAAASSAVPGLAPEPQLSTSFYPMSWYEGGGGGGGRDGTWKAASNGVRWDLAEARPLPAWPAEADLDSTVQCAEEDAVEHNGISSPFTEEEEEQARHQAERDGTGPHASEVTRWDGRDHPRLHLHPLASSAMSANATAYGGALDPITAALARQHQQLSRGEPRSPLSPRTLQALCSASVEGRRDGFLAGLTPEDVLAPPPLALTWYPSVPPNVTQHADRKRMSDGSVTLGRERHEMERLAEGEAGEREGEAMCDVPQQPFRRPRIDPFAPTATPSPNATATTATAAAVVNGSMVGSGIVPLSSTTQQDAQVRETATAATPSHEREGEGEDDERPSMHLAGHRKRLRGDRSEDGPSHGRRLH